MSLTDVRNELAALIQAAAVADELAITAYASVPGAASLPAVIVGLPRRYIPRLSHGLRQVELPLYVVTTAADPASEESALLELVELVCPLLQGLQGTTFLSCRVPDVDQFFDVTVGAGAALSATVNAEITLR